MIEAEDKKEVPMNGPKGHDRGIGRGAAGLAVTVLVLAGGAYAQSRAADMPAGISAPGPSEVAAQAVPDRCGQAAADPELAAALAGKKKARVLTPSGPLVLRRPQLAPEGLRGFIGLKDRERSRIVPWSDVSAVQVRRSGVGKGALLGAGIGAGLGLALGLASTRECSGWMDMFCEATAGDVVLVTAFGGASGGLLGAAIGALTGSWGTVYARPKAVQRLPCFSVVPAPGGGVIFSLSLSL
jgi:hypothetical protein